MKAVKHFHVYLYGRKFLLRTDHAALRWLLSFRQPEGQVARWIEALQQYDFTIEHRPGSKHGNADALSRRPCLQDTCRHCDRLESVEHSHNATESSSINSTIHKDHCPQVSSISLGQESQSHEDIRKAQLIDEDIKPVIELMEQNREKPSWEVIAPSVRQPKSTAPSGKVSRCPMVSCIEFGKLPLVTQLSHKLFSLSLSDKVFCSSCTILGHPATWELIKPLAGYVRDSIGYNADKMCKSGAETVIFVPKSEVHRA